MFHAFEWFDDFDDGIWELFSLNTEASTGIRVTFDSNYYNFRVWLGSGLLATPGSLDEAIAMANTVAAFLVEKGYLDGKLPEEAEDFDRQI